MSGTERDLSILAHIRGYCEQIEGTLLRFGDDPVLFREDFVYQNAMAMCLLQIGELAGHLTEEYRAAHTEIPWRQIRALRNIIAHNYGAVDAETAWEIVHDDLPRLKDYCEAALAAKEHP